MCSSVSAVKLRPQQAQILVPGGFHLAERGRPGKKGKGADIVACEIRDLGRRGYGVHSLLSKQEHGPGHVDGRGHQHERVVFHDGG